MDEQAPNYHREFLKSPQHAALGLLTLGVGFMSGMALPSPGIWKRCGPGIKRTGDPSPTR